MPTAGLEASTSVEAFLGNFDSRFAQPIQAPPEAAPVPAPLNPDNLNLIPQPLNVNPGTHSAPDERGRLPIWPSPSLSSWARTTSDVRFYCLFPDCRVSCSRHHDLKRHILTIHSLVGYRCDECRHVMNREDKAQEHCRNVHIQMAGAERYTPVQTDSPMYGSWIMITECPS